MSFSCFRVGDNVFNNLPPLKNVLAYREKKSFLTRDILAMTMLIDVANLQ